MGAAGFNPTASAGGANNRHANPTAWRMNAQARSDEARRRGLKLVPKACVTPTATPRLPPRPMRNHAGLVAVPARRGRIGWRFFRSF